MATSLDVRLSSPAAFRNRVAILDVLRPLLPAQGLVLEVASRSGQHIVHFAEHLPQLAWQPSDPSAEARASIAAWTATEGATNVLPPLDLDASNSPWPVSKVDAIISINMVHISPWVATQGLLKEAGGQLPAHGFLYIYGPFIEASVPLAPSNAAFDDDLRRRNPAWGLRDLADIKAEAQRSGLYIEAVAVMPANNLSLVLRRA